MKRLVFIFVVICISLSLSVWSYAETCPCCGHEIAPTVVITVEKYPDGSMKKWTETTTDSYGKILGTRTDEYTYFKKGQIHEIVQKRFNGSNKLLDMVKVTHYEDGKQPTAEKVEGESK